MPIIDLLLPKMGESIMEATILKWHKKLGDTVKKGEIILEIATDKVDSEVPSIADGIVSEILYKENDVVAVGTVIARIQNFEWSEIENSSIEIKPTRSFVPTDAPKDTPEIEQKNINYKYFYSPAVLHLAATKNISIKELNEISGTGNKGRISKKDLVQYSNNRKIIVPNDANYSTESKVSILPIEPSISTNENIEVIEMDRMRKLIAEHMVRSKATAPHVTSFMEVDVTKMVQWRDKVKVAFEKKHDEKITYTPIFIEAVVHAIKKFPMINASINGDKIIIKKDINIGMATALPSGSLIVPVIKNADQKNIIGLVKEVNRLAYNARNTKLLPNATQGGTFTLTNVGTFGSLMGTPIINQPQVAILAIGAIKKRPVVIETDQGDLIAIRHMMYLSLSYDHRIVDGSIGASFITEVAKQLEAFDSNREI